MGLLLKLALDQAAVWHRGQLRKYARPANPTPEQEAGVPYVSHCAGVVATLARHGFDEEVLAAGALHDCVEDCGVTFARLEELFGARVARLVREVTEEDKSLAWEERKRLYLEHFRVKPWEAQAITLADKIDNFESIVICARRWGDPWSQFKRGREAQLVRFEALDAALDALAPHALIAEYREALAGVRSV